MICKMSQHQYNFSRRNNATDQLWYVSRGLIKVWDFEERRRRTLVLRYTVRQTMSVLLHREPVITVLARPNLRTEAMTIYKNESR